MKINQPVTNREVKLQDNQELVSKTDLKGTITYANPAFVEISGFTHEELMGTNHNLVRHPDMPPAAFKHLWDTLKLGRPWTNLVKNRCKNGDFYWVRANVIPVYKNGQIVEYMSVRTRPSQAEIDQAEALYQKINRKEAALPAPESIPSRDLATLSFKPAIWGVTAALILDLLIYLITVEMGAALALGPVLGFIIMFIGFNQAIQDKVIKPSKTLQEKMKAIAEGVYLKPIALEEAGEMGELQREAKNLAVQLGFEVNSSKEAAMNAQRIKVALDNVTSNVMVADNERTIIYCNDAVLRMLTNAAEDIKEQIPDFDVDTIVGGSLDRFHKEPKHQQQMIKALTSTHYGRIKVGRRSFDLTANPVLDEKNQRLGTVVEWKDITDQLFAEQQVHELILNASKGQLAQRLDEEAYEDFLKAIAQGINQMLDAMVGPLIEVKKVASAIDNGDLTQQMSGQYEGEFAELTHSLNSSIQNLNQLVMQITSSGDNVRSAASEISAGNITLSNSTEAQAAALEETAASMEEMTSTVKLNADNASDARELVNNSKLLAERGGQISERVTTAMGEINACSSQIADIIGVIDEIAFQTNLLALNAAVEAARAGEQGRGFAVVASEVRNLAQRSASAAKEIKDLINDSVEKVSEGNLLVTESSDALQEIIHSIAEVADIISGIADASREQAVGIEQVNKAIVSMDEGTQQNAALVEQVAAASSSMESEAGQLQELVSRFKVH